MEHGHPAMLGAALAAGFLAGLVAAGAVLAQGGGLLSALVAYSGVGMAAILVGGAMTALRGRTVREEARRGHGAPSPARG